MVRWRGLTVSAGARIAATYLAIALIYIYASDWVLASFVADKESFLYGQIAKGFGFVGITAGGLMLLIDREIAKREAAEAEVAAHAKRLQEVADALPQPLLIFAVEDRRLLFANRSAFVFAGIAGPRGLDALDICSFFAKSEEFDAVTEKVFSDGAVVGREITARPIESYDVFLAVSARRMTYGGEDAVCATFTDLSEIRVARESERRTYRLLQEILDNLPGGVALKDLSGRYLLASQNYIKLMPSEQIAVVGYRAEELYNADFVSSAEIQDREVAASGKPQAYKIVLEVGRAQPQVVELIKFPVLSAAGELEALGCIAFDITEQTAMEQQLRRTERLETLGQMTGGIAHDFNNLLAAILGNAEILAESPEDAGQVRQASKVIETAALRGSDLTRRLLVFARQQSLRNESLSVAAIMEDLSQLLSRSLGEDVILELQLAEGLWPVEVDRSQLENAILNLAVNARDAMPNGGSLRISARNVDAMEDGILAGMDQVAEHYVCLSVSDSGDGMSAETLDHIFEPFFTTKEPGKGTGLGLSMVYGFARQSRGAVRAESAPGKGTTVFLYLPWSAAPAAAPEVEDGKPQLAEDGKGARVLVVEDEPMVRGYIVMVLKQLGFDVVEAGNGRDALERLQNDGDFDLLFSDMIMPGGLNGRDLAEEAKKLRPSLRVLLTTGYAEHPSFGRGASGEIEFLRKPYRREELIAALNATLAA
ncbi:MAG: ATP-binding protein [Rhodovibrionaceae bacterium]